MTKEADDAFMNQLRQKFLEAADWPLEKRVEFQNSIGELVSKLGDGTLARGIRTGAIKPAAAVATTPEKIMGDPRSEDNPINQREAELRSASMLADPQAQTEAVKEAEKPKAADAQKAEKSQEKK